MLTVFIFGFNGCSNTTERQFTEHLRVLLENSEKPYSDDVIDKVFDIIKSCPASLNYDLEYWNGWNTYNNMHIETSDDGMVRTYSIERNGFGGNSSNVQESRTLIQTQLRDSVLCNELSDCYNVPCSIIKIADSQQYYLFEFIGGSARFSTETLSVYSISDEYPQWVNNAFLQNHDSSVDNITFGWEDSGVDGEGNTMESVRLCETFDVKGESLYNKRLQVLYVPNVVRFGAGYHILDGTYSVYKWNIFHFEQSIPCARIEAVNNEYRISIEQMEDGECIYRCWNGSIKKGVPDLTIDNGTMQYIDYEGNLVDYDKWVSNDDSQPNGEKYIFVNNGYRYEYFSLAMEECLYVYDPAGNTIYAKTFERIIN